MSKKRPDIISSFDQRQAEAVLMLRKAKQFILVVSDRPLGEPPERDEETEAIAACDGAFALMGMITISEALTGSDPEAIDEEE